MTLLFLVFVLLTTFEVLVEIMAVAHNLGLTAKEKPHRAFIGFQLDAKIRRENYVRKSEFFFSNVANPVGVVQYRAMRGARALLIISAAQPRNYQRYTRFQQKLVDRTENAPPFKDRTVYDPIVVGIILHWLVDKVAAAQAIFCP